MRLCGPLCCVETNLDLFSFLKMKEFIPKYLVVSLYTNTDRVVSTD